MWRHIAWAIATSGALAPLPARAEDPPPCVDVRVGGQQFYDCLNARLAQAIPAHRSSALDVPLRADSPAPATGTFNQAATRQTLGANFGHGVVPQRPAADGFVNPLVPRSR